VGAQHSFGGNDNHHLALLWHIFVILTPTRPISTYLHQRQSAFLLIYLLSEAILHTIEREQLVYYRRGYSNLVIHQKCSANTE